MVCGIENMTRLEDGLTSQPIRVLSANFPAETKAALDEALRDEPEFHTVGSIDIDFDRPEGILRLLETIGRLQGYRSELLVVVLYSDQEFTLPNIFKHLMQEYPDLRVLVFAHHQTVASAYWMGLNKVVLYSAHGDSASDSLRAGITYLAHVNPQALWQDAQQPRDNPT
jgi:hypothetical protein